MSQAFKLEGFKELSDELSMLGSRAGGRVLRQAVGLAMTPVVRNARRNSPKGHRAHKTFKGRLVAPGFLSRNIRKKTWSSRDGQVAQAMVGVSGEAYYGLQFLEQGTDYIEENPWLTDTFRSSQNEVLNKFKAQLTKKILKLK